MSQSPSSADVRSCSLSPSSSGSASQVDGERERTTRPPTNRPPPPPPTAERQRAIEKRSELSRRLLRELQATAGSLYEQRLFREAVEVYKCLTALAPSQPYHWYWLGQSYYAVGDVLGAARAFERGGRLSHALQFNLLAAEAWQRAGYPERAPRVTSAVRHAATVRAEVPRERATSNPATSNSATSNPALPVNTATTTREGRDPITTDAHTPAPRPPA